MMGHLSIGFYGEVEVFRYFSKHSTERTSTGLVVVGVVYFHSVEVKRMGVVGEHVSIRDGRRINGPLPIGKGVSAVSHSKHELPLFTGSEDPEME